MDRIKAFFSRKKVDAEEYEPLTDDSATLEESTYEAQEENPFSWLEYWIFLIIGVAMLWAWYAIFFLLSIGWNLRSTSRR